MPSMTGSRTAQTANTIGSPVRSSQRRPRSWCGVGSSKALRSAFEDPTPHHDLGRIWTERTGLPMVFAVWACGDPPPAGVEELEDALVASVRQARSEPEVLAHEAMDRYGYPAGFLARYFEKLRYRFGPRERAALFTFLELARDAGELDRVPNLRFVYGEAVPA